MSDTGIGQKLVEVGVSAVQAVGDELQSAASIATNQITGGEIKSDAELAHIATQDKAYSQNRIQEIQQQLAQQKVKRFHEVSNWTNTTPTLPPSQEQSGPQIPGSASSLNSIQSTRSTSTPESVRQAVGRGEQGRNYKG